jgi:hypothetical protein
MGPVKTVIDWEMMPLRQTIHPPNRDRLVSAGFDGRARIEAVISPNHSRPEVAMELLAELGHDDFQRRGAAPT